MTGLRIWPHKKVIQDLKVTPSKMKVWSKRRQLRNKTISFLDSIMVEREWPYFTFLSALWSFCSVHVIFWCSKSLFRYPSHTQIAQWSRKLELLLTILWVKEKSATFSFHSLCHVFNLEMPSLFSSLLSRRRTTHASVMCVQDMLIIDKGYCERKKRAENSRVLCGKCFLSRDVKECEEGKRRDSMPTHLKTMKDSFHADQHSFYLFNWQKFSSETSAFCRKTCWCRQ